MKVSVLLRLLAVACTAAGCAACGSSLEHSLWHPGRLLPHHAPAPAAAVQQASRPSPDRDMVSAVSNSKGIGDVPVEVKFALRERPEVGKPAELDLEMIPSAPLDRLIAVFHAQDGLSVNSGAGPVQLDRPEPGVPISHRLTIVPQHDGIFYVDTTVLADFGSQSIGRTFTIPVIAGSGAP